MSLLTLSNGEVMLLTPEGDLEPVGLMDEEGDACSHDDGDDEPEDDD